MVPQARSISPLRIPANLLATLLASALLAGCTTVANDNPWDPNSPNYGNFSEETGSSSEELGISSSATSSSTDLSVAASSSSSGGSSAAPSSSAAISSSVQLEILPGVLSDFSLATHFDGWASTAGGQWLGYWAGYSDALHGGTSEVRSLTSATLVFGAGDTLVQQAVAGGALTGKLSITDYVNPSGWGWASAGWDYLFKPLGGGVLGRAGLPANASFTVVLQHDAGRKIRVMAIEDNFVVDATHATPYFEINPTGGLDTVTFAMSQLEVPNWATNTFNPDDLVALQFLRTEGALTSGALIGANAGITTLRIYKLSVAF